MRTAAEESERAGIATLCERQCPRSRQVHISCHVALTDLSAVRRHDFLEGTQPDHALAAADLLPDGRDGVSAHGFVLLQQLRAQVDVSCYGCCCLIVRLGWLHFYDTADRRRPRRVVEEG